MIRRAVIRNVLAIRALDLQPTNLVTLIAARNYSGKTSLLDAIRIGLTGVLVRGLVYKQEAGELVSDGAKEATIAFEFDNGDKLTRTIKAGAIAHDGAAPAAYDTPALGIALNAQAFASYDVAEKRTLLFALTETKATGKWVTERLLAEGMPQDVVDQVLGWIKGGWDLAQTNAARKVADATGAWRGVTGEKYGHRKAEGWEAGLPDEGPKVDLEVKRDTLKRAEGTLAKLNERVTLARKVADFGALPSADTLEEKKAEIVRGEAKLAGLQKKLAGLTAKAATAGTGGVQAPCPCCNAMLVIDRGTLSRYEAADPAAAAEAPTARAELQREIAGVETKLGTLRAAANDLAAKLAAAKVFFDTEEGLEGLDYQKAADEAGEQASHVQQLRADIDLAERAQAAREAAIRKTTEAAEHHRAAQLWAKAEQLVSPDGLPNELLLKALGPFRALLARHPDGWPPVTLDDSMQIRIGGRRYALCSESEQWRADAACAVAIAALARSPLLLLDRLDVIDAAERMDVIDWLAETAEKAGLQIFVAGTFKGDPTDNLPEIGVVWLEGNRAEDRAAA